MNKLLTISIAAYNVDKYLNETLDSMLIKRNLDKLEVLIIDDGSTDKTTEIAKDYEKKYQDVFRTIRKENGGHGSTINCGIKHASGKYFKVVDGDDKLDRDELDGFIDMLSERDEDLILNNTIRIYSDKDSVRQTELDGLELLKPFLWDGLYEDIFIWLPAITIRTGVYKSYNLDVVENVFYDDLEWDVNCIFSSKTLCYTDCNLYLYRCGRENQSISWKNRKRNYKMLKEVAIGIANKYEKSKGNCSDMQRRCALKVVSFAYYSLVTTFLAFRGSEKKKNELFEVINRCPSKEVIRKMKKDKPIVRILLLWNNMYYFVSLLYKILKGIKSEKDEM